MKFFKKFLLIIFCIFLISVISIGTFVGNLLYNTIISSKSSKDIIYADYSYESSYYYENWLAKISNYKNKYITSFDNLKLHSYMVKRKKKTSKWVIIVHGYGEEGKSDSRKALHFYKMGYNVLIPDLRGSGKSEGDYIGMGWDDRLDIISWANSIIKEDKQAEIVLYGTSMGGSTVLMASGEDLPSNIKAIISDCAYTSIYDLFDYEVRNYMNSSSFPIIDFLNATTVLRAGYSLKSASPIDAVKKSKVPILYFHGDKDSFVPISMMNKLYDATSSTKKKVTIKGGEHANSDLAQPKTYWTSIKNFLKQYVN